MDPTSLYRAFFGAYLCLHFAFRALDALLESRTEEERRTWEKENGLNLRVHETMMFVFLMLTLLGAMQLLKFAFLTIGTTGCSP